MSRRKLPAKKDVEDDDSVKVDDLLAKIKELTIENEELKKQLTDVRKEEHQQPLATPKRKQKSKSPRNSQVFAKSVIGTPTSNKGCSCKGNCSTRICGCMKKNIACNELCRCQAEKCCNKEDDQENIGDTNNQALARHPALESGLKESDRVTKTRGLFSPEDTENVKEKTSQAESREKPRKMKKNNETVGRSRRDNLHVSDQDKKSRSVSNEEVKSQTSLGDKHEKGKRSVSVESRVGNTKSSKNKSEKTVKETLKEWKPAIQDRRKKRNTRKSISTDDNDYEINSDDEEKDKKKKAANSLNSRPFRKAAKEEPAPKTSKYIDSNDSENEEDVPMSSPEVDEKENNTTPEKKQIFSEDESNNDDNNLESSTAGSKSSNDSVQSPDNLLNVENTVLDPMKPRRQLQRSPVVQRQNDIPILTVQTAHVVRDPSQKLLPIPPPEIKPEIEEKPPEDLSKPVVDWEQHKAILVKCSKCSRTFYPHRLKKHEAHCHKK